MKSNLLTVFSTVFLFLFISCHSRDHVWNEESNRVAIEVRKTLQAYFDDINRNGFLAEFKYLDSTENFSWHPPGFTTSISFDSVRTILLENAKQVNQVNSVWDSLTVYPESADQAKYIGDITSRITNHSGHTDTIRLHEEGNMIKRKDGWKLLSGVTVMK